MAAPMRQRVTITNELLSTLASNSGYVREFQFLSRLRDAHTGKPKKKGSCGGCSRTARADSALFNAAKQAIAGMSSERKRKLRQMLNTNQILVTFVHPSGKAEDRYF